MERKHSPAVRFLSLLLTLCLLCGVFAGCDRGGSTTTAPSTTAPQATVPGEEYTLPHEDGYNQITFYWAKSGTVTNPDVWVWLEGAEGKGYILYPCEYGYKAVINVPEGVEKVGFIVRYNCSDPGGTSWGEATKDFDQDRFAVIEGKDTFIYLKSGDGNQYTSNDGGKTLTMIKKFTMAGMNDFNTIQYDVTPKVKIDDLSQIKLYEGDKQIAISGLTTLGMESTGGRITTAEKLDPSKVYTLELPGFGKKEVVPYKIFDCEEFVNNYTYDGNDLGAVITGDSTTFKVWAPTASKVVLNLYTDGHTDSLIKSVDMIKGERGVWSYTEACGHGTYYTYTVTTAVGTQDATDPYAKAAGVNGNRSMVVDLSLTDPMGWESDKVVELESYTDAVIWEIHVRDFSNKIPSSQYKGKYLAFTERGLVNEQGVSVGIDYLLELGITHVHLLPVYDYATVDESNPDSSFNWGYDPKNYNVPEGSYSTDPYNGEVRIMEFKQMVQALHNVGIGVIMDVVYNHTYDGNASFNKIVPYYYYRFNADGSNVSASGCGNDTASERYMFGKFMVDSVTYWATEYNLDGFRFDLMGLHDLETMDEVEKAVHAVNPDAIIYGEGWTMGATVDGSAQANQSNISQIVPSEGAAGSVAVFNDAIRDGLKGSVFDPLSQGYINGAYGANATKVKFGINGGAGSGATWRVTGAAVINYMSAHDNNTLWDKLSMANADNTLEERLAMNRLGAAIVMISKGTPFWQAGEEMLRSKPDGEGGYDENSYKSSDEVNNIRWDALVPGSNEYEMMLYYKGLIAMRQAYEIFRGAEDVKLTFNNISGGGMEVLFEGADGSRALVVINPTGAAASYTLKEAWNLVADATRAGAEVLETQEGSIKIEPYSVRIYVD